MAKQQRLTGYTHFFDELTGDNIMNGMTLDVAHERRRLIVGPVSEGWRSGIIEARTPEQVRYVDSVIAEMRRQQGRRRPANPVPKPAGNRRRRSVPRVCPTCAGDGIVDDVLGGMMSCPDCGGET